MDNFTDNSVKFFFDQVVRQYQDLKLDLRQEVGDLKRQLSHDAKEQALELKEFKQETNARFEKIEKQIIDLQSWKWYIAGAAAFAFALAELGIKALEYYLSK